MGTYKLGVDSFVRAYTRQMEVEYEAKGGEYEVDEDAMGYLQCQQYYYNNNLVSRMFGNIDKSCILRVHTYHHLIPCSIICEAFYSNFHRRIFFPTVNNSYTYT